MDAKDGAYNAVQTYLSDYEAKSQSNISYRSVDGVKQEFAVYKEMFSTVGIVLGLIFGVIGLLNLVNVILTNAVSRQREFAIMQSIGMTRKQLKRLFVIEGLLYAAIAGVVSLLASAVLSLTAVNAMAGGIWYCTYHFTILPALALVPAYLLVAAVIASVVDRVWNNGSVVERLRRAK